MKGRVLLSVGICFALLVWGVNAQAKSSARKGHIGGEVIVWWSSLDGNVSLNTSDLEGTNLNLQNILALQKTRPDIELGLWVSPISRWKISLYWLMDQRTGSQLVQLPITVGGKTIGGTIDSKITMQRWKFMNEIAIINNDLGRIAIGVGVVYIEGLAKVSGTSTINGLYGSENGRVPIPFPVLGVAGELHIPKLFGLGVFAEGVGFKANYSKYSASYVDARGGINMKTRFIYGQAGYQLINMVVKAADIADLGLKMQGPFISLGAKF